MKRHLVWAILTTLVLILTGCELFESHNPPPEPCYGANYNYCEPPIPDPKIFEPSPDLSGPQQIRVGECAKYSLDLTNWTVDPSGTFEVGGYQLELYDSSNRDVMVGSFYQDPNCSVPLDVSETAKQPLRLRGKVTTLYLKRDLAGELHTLDGFKLTVLPAETPRPVLEWKVSDRWGGNPYYAKSCLMDSGSMSKIILTITNRGDAPATGLFMSPTPSEVAFPGTAFLINMNRNCPDTIAVGQSCQLQVWFENPGDLGHARGFLSLGYLGPDNQASQAPLILEVETLACSDY